MLILFNFIALILCEPLIQYSLKLVSHANFEEYDFPSVLIHEPYNADMNMREKEPQSIKTAPSFDWYGIMFFLLSFFLKFRMRGITF